MKKLFITFFLIILGNFAWANKINLSNNIRIIIPDSSNYIIFKEDKKTYTYINISERNKKWTLQLSMNASDSPSVQLKKLHKLTLKRGKALLKYSLEKSISIQDITRGNNIVGYFFTLTDKAPKKNEYKYLIQGYINYNYAPCYFTLLSNSKSKLKNHTAFKLINKIQTERYHKQTINFEKVKILPNDVPTLTIGNIDHFYSMQVVIFNNNQKIYEGILPKISESYSQSYYKSKDVGTIFYYKFNKNLSSSHRGFITSLLYGDTQMPSKHHPEDIIIKNDIFIIISYSNKSSLKNKLKRIILEKLKNKTLSAFLGKGLSLKD